MPRSMASDSSWSSGSAPATPYSAQLAWVKDEPEEVPHTRSRRGKVVINERHAASLPRGHIRLVMPKTEPGTGGSSARKPKEPEWSAPRENARSALKAEAPDNLEESPS